MIGGLIMPDKIRTQFIKYGDVVEKDSPFYKQLAHLIANNDELLLQLKPYWQTTHFFSLYFASVLKALYIHDHKLREYYLNFNDKPKKLTEEKFDVFIDFQNTYFDEIIMDVQSQFLKKNIVERASVFIPIFNEVIQSHVEDDFNFIELGALAGLLLNYDWYGYTFNKSVELGQVKDLNIKVKLNDYHDEIKEMMHPTFKVGITNKKYDLLEDEDYFWLISLFYPEEIKRRKHFIKAREIFLKHPVNILEGNELELLEMVLSQLDNDKPTIIYHIHTTKSWSDDKKIALMDIIQNYANQREIYHIHHQIFGTDIICDTFENGQLVRKKYANFNLNEMTIEWMKDKPVVL
ncbi:DUF2332 family protein [Macrococcus sp. DPC7161]|nr:DUF2332 family protein [Macrococcus sp. DPC7161]